MTQQPMILESKLEKSLVSWDFKPQFNKYAVLVKVRYWAGGIGIKKVDSERYKFYISFSKAEMMTFINRLFGESLDEPKPTGSAYITSCYDLVSANKMAAKCQDSLKATIEQAFMEDYRKATYDDRIADFPKYKPELMRKMAICNAFIEYMKNYKFASANEAIKDIKALLMT